MNRTFTQLTERHFAALRHMVGDAYLITEPSELEVFSHDETEDLRFLPQAAIRPADTEEVSQILRFANEELIAVTPRGGGTGLSGGCLPVYGGITLSLDRLDQVIEIDTDNLFCVTQPGIVVQTLQETIEETGLFYPVDPASRGSCFIGGNVAENSGGPRAVKYGVTKDFVMGLTAVLPTGEAIKTGGKIYKDVTGYNLTQTLVGSEGTLAVITEIVLRLLPLPNVRSLLMIPFPDLDSAAQTVAAIKHSGTTPSALEFMERDAIISARDHLRKKIEYDDAPAQLLIELDGEDLERVEAQTESIGEIALKHGALDVLLAESQQRQDELWAIRRSMGEAVKHRSIYKEEDTVVPPAKIPELLRRVKALCAERRISSVCYGHAGDGNIHVNLLKDDLPDEVWNNQLDSIIRELFGIVIDLGGALTGEHGVGYSQKEFLPIMKSPAEIALMKRMKHSFDPNGILNPGKVFPAEVS